jgi:hypothetical protein
MNAFVTKDPSKGFGAGTLFESVPTEDLTTQQMERRKRSGAAPIGATMKKGGSVGSASKRADGCAVKGKTRGTMITMKGGGYAC